MKTHIEMDNLFDFLEPEEERIKRRESDTNVGNVVTASHGTNIVKESNRLIYSCYTLTEIEQKLMYCFIRHIQWDDTIRRYTVSVQEIKEICGFSDSRLYNVIAQAADKLLSRVVTIRSHEKNAWVKINWLSFIKYADGKLTFEFNPYLKDDLLDLQSRFTIFDVQLPMRLTGAYTSRLYLLLKKMEHLNSSLHILMVDDLKEAFELSKSMSTVDKIRTRIIEPSLEQINKVTDISVTYEPIKDGKKIISFRFFIKPNKKYLKQLKERNANVPDNQVETVNTTATDTSNQSVNAQPAEASPQTIANFDELYALVEKYGIGKKLFENSLEEIDAESKADAVKYAVEVYEKDTKSGKSIKNPATYIAGVIKNYDPTTKHVEQQKRSSLSEEEQEAIQRIMAEEQIQTKTETPADMIPLDKLQKMSVTEIQSYYDGLVSMKKTMFKMMLQSSLPDIANKIKF